MYSKIKFLSPPLRRIADYYKQFVLRVAVFVSRLVLRRVKFDVDVNGQNIIFEPDEERSYRAVINYVLSITTGILRKNY